MAKKKSDDPFAELDGIIEKEFDDAVDMSKVDTRVSTWYDSGVYAFNYICSKNIKGAYPKGRIIGLDGLSSTGKSLMAAVAMRDPQIDRIIIIESEGGGNSAELMDFAGVDPKKVRIMKASTLQSYSIDKKSGAIEEVPDNKVPKNKDTDKYRYVEGAGLKVRRLAHAIQFNNIKGNFLIIMDSLGNMQSVRGLSGCYVGETLITTIDGDIKISEIEVGDKVLTHLGNFKEVNKKYEYDDKDELIEIDTDEGDKIKLTPNHKLLVRRDNEIIWVPAEEIRITDNLLRIE